MLLCEMHRQISIKYADIETFQFKFYFSIFIKLTKEASIFGVYLVNLL